MEVKQNKGENRNRPHRRDKTKTNKNLKKELARADKKKKNLAVHEDEIKQNETKIKKMTRTSRKKQIKRVGKVVL